MPGLLVSVRSAVEAGAAVRAGAAVIDVKEPANGPLGLASIETWAAVRAEVPRAVPVSVALGELAEWGGKAVDPDAWSGIAYRKIGSSQARLGWPGCWADLRSRLPGPPWIAVAYADWAESDAPEPDAVLDAALLVPDCVGLLIDTYGKDRANPVDESWFPLIARAKAAGRLVALAGRLDGAAIRRLAPLGPDLFAVRGAACVGGDRSAPIDPDRVAELVRIIASVGI